MGDMIFKPAARYPADPRAVFILALSVFSGITALALQVAPESLEALLPKWGIVVWGITLALGSGVTLLGMLFQSVNGIITEQVGNAMVSAATILYASIALWFVGISAIQTVGIILAWGIACALRWIQLQVLIDSAYQRQRKDEVLAKVYAEIEARAQAEIERRANRAGRLR